MIEFCSKKRMVIAILLLICSSIVILVLENKWSSEHLREAHMAARESTNETCKSVVKVLDDCKRCTRDELRNEVSYCVSTGFKELIECEGGMKHYRRCDILPVMEQKTFWIFEGMCLGLGVVSYLVVYYRQHRLDNLMMEKINRQIASAM